MPCTCYTSLSLDIVESGSPRWYKWRCSGHTPRANLFPNVSWRSGGDGGRGFRCRLWEGIHVLSAENQANVLISALGINARGVTSGASGRESPRAARSCALTMPKAMEMRTRYSMMVSWKTVLFRFRFVSLRESVHPFPSSEGAVSFRQE